MNRFTPRHLFRPLLVVALVAGGAYRSAADASPPLDGQPAASNVPGAATPRVHPNGAVTFALKAPQANHVQLAGGDGLGKGPFAMARADDGVWSVTLPSVVPGFHYYWFLLDGVAVNDPGSRTFFGYGKETSGVEVPELSVNYYDIREVPHGEVRARSYWSKTTGRWRRCHVYTPPDYDQDQRRRYPVLYLQHGAGEDETGWIRQGRIQFILDNLIAEGRAAPMLVVMDRGYANDAASNAPAAGLAAFAAFEKVLVDDVVPMIDAAYRTLADREHRALAGLSMGGMQTLFIASHHLNRFAYLGSFSGPIRTGSNAGRGAGPGAPPPPLDPATAYDGLFKDAGKFNSTVKLLWLGAGSAEPEIRDSIRSAATALKSAGVQVTYYESQGTAHEWQTWRRHAREFLPKLFR